MYDRKASSCEKMRCWSASASARPPYESFIKTGRLRFVKIGARAVGIIEDELDALIEELRRERDRGRDRSRPLAVARCSVH